MVVNKEVLKALENYINEKTKNVNVKVCRRYNYYAIDLSRKDGQIIDTLISGLTKREAYDILLSINEILKRER